jgi:hypothetical protein
MQYILLYIPHIQNLVKVTKGGGVSHKNTKYIQLVKYKDVIRISHRAVKCYTKFIMYFLIIFFSLPKIVPSHSMGLLCFIYLFITQIPLILLIT